jgi:2-desacetyl-2-hydroxyethyl bacteriochlorophyllide A dehydrogenase
MTSTTMNAAVLTSYNKIEWQTVSIPEISENEMLVEVGYAGICGSDQHIFTGDFAPRTSTPLIQGHEFGGRIVKTGSKVDKFKIGNRVVVDPILPCGECTACELGHFPACTSLKLIGVDMDGGFGQYVKAAQNMCYHINDAISDRHAALVELFSIGFHASNRSGLKTGDTAVIWGGGRVGQVIMQAARTITDAPIFVVDVSDNRLAIAAKTCKDIIPINSRKQDPLQVIREATSERGVDVAFEAVGHGVEIENVPDPVVGCVRAIRGAGTVCVLGLSDHAVPLVMKEIIWKEAKIVASRVSHGEFSDAIEAMQNKQINPEALITSEMHGSNTQQAFETLAEDPDGQLKIILQFSER